MQRTKGNFLGYNTLKGRLIMALIVGVAIFIGIVIIDTKSLHSLNLNLKNSAVTKYIDVMSIFVFSYGMIFILYGMLGTYDILTFMTSQYAYAPKIFFIIIIILGILQSFAGIDTVGRLFQMNGLLVAKQANIYSGMYLFGAAIKSVLYSLSMYVVRMLSKYFMNRSHDKMIEKDKEMRERIENINKIFDKN